MKPGDLLQPRRFNITRRTRLEYLCVWDRPDGHESWTGHWYPRQAGMLLEGRYEDGDLILIEVLLDNRRCWAIEDEVEVIDEAR